MNMECEPGQSSAYAHAEARWIVRYDDGTLARVCDDCKQTWGPNAEDAADTGALIGRA